MSAEPRYSRKRLRGDPPGRGREGYEQALAATYEALSRPVDGSPTTALELAELQRLIRRYPQHAARLVAELQPPT